LEPEVREFLRKRKKGEENKGEVGD